MSHHEYKAFAKLTGLSVTQVRRIAELHRQPTAYHMLYYAPEGGSGQMVSMAIEPGEGTTECIQEVFGPKGVDLAWMIDDAQPFEAHLEIDPIVFGPEWSNIEWGEPPSPCDPADSVDAGEIFERTQRKIRAQASSSSPCERGTGGDRYPNV